MNPWKEYDKAHTDMWGHGSVLRSAVRCRPAAIADDLPPIDDETDDLFNDDDETDA